MNTLENNKLIAEFLGANGEFINENGEVFLNNIPNPEGGKMILRISRLKYNESWDWLMEVLEKIKQKYSFVNINISTGETSISLFDINGKNHFTTCPKNNYEGATMLSATYKAVVNFIEWSNEQNS